jgi:hypothetical protein
VFSPKYILLSFKGLICNLWLFVLYNSSFTLIEQLQNEYPYSVDEGNGEDAFGGSVAVGIYVECEESDIAYQAPDAKKGDQPVLPEKSPYKFTKFITRKLKVIDDDQNKHRGDKPKY